MKVMKLLHNGVQGVFSQVLIKPYGVWFIQHFAHPALFWAHKNWINMLFVYTKWLLWKHLRFLLQWVFLWGWGNGLHLCKVVLEGLMRTYIHYLSYLNYTIMLTGRAPKKFGTNYARTVDRKGPLASFIRFQFRSRQ